jgi:hypothetical protein
MAVYRMQCAFQYNSAFPRDRMVITPHFEDTGVGSDPDGLTADLAAALQTWSGSTGEIRVTSYDAQGTPPVYPNGETILNPGLVGGNNFPSEIALCLSYYSQRNIPRQRGRLYLPVPIVAAAGNIGVIPTATQIAKAMALAPILGDLGGPDVDFVVWSRTAQAAYPVTDYWVDNEWDVQRSRGLRATDREVGTLAEA